MAASNRDRGGGRGRGWNGFSPPPLMDEPDPWILFQTMKYNKAKGSSSGSIKGSNSTSPTLVELIKIPTAKEVLMEEPQYFQKDVTKTIFIIENKDLTGSLICGKSRKDIWIFLIFLSLMENLDMVMNTFLKKQVIWILPTHFQIQSFNPQLLKPELHTLNVEF